MSLFLFPFLYFDPLNRDTSPELPFLSSTPPTAFFSFSPTQQKPKQASVPKLFLSAWDNDINPVRGRVGETFTRVKRKAPGTLYNPRRTQRQLPRYNLPHKINIINNIVKIYTTSAGTGDMIILEWAIKFTLRNFFF